MVKIFGSKCFLIPKNLGILTDEWFDRGDSYCRYSILGNLWCLGTSHLHFMYTGFRLVITNFTRAVGNRGEILFILIQDRWEKLKKGKALIIIFKNLKYPTKKVFLSGIYMYIHMRDEICCLATLWYKKICNYRNFFHLLLRGRVSTFWCRGQLFFLLI